MLEGLGATFVKVGQIMSTRPDLLPSEIIAELVQLQENVRPFPVAEVKPHHRGGFAPSPE